MGWGGGRIRKKLNKTEDENIEILIKCLKQVKGYNYIQLYHMDKCLFVLVV